MNESLKHFCTFFTLKHLESNEVNKEALKSLYSFKNNFKKPAKTPKNAF
jgi:hypothetical protein